MTIEVKILTPGYKTMSHTKFIELPWKILAIDMYHTTKHTRINLTVSHHVNYLPLYSHYLQHYFSSIVCYNNIW